MRNLIFLLPLLALVMACQTNKDSPTPSTDPVTFTAGEWRFYPPDAGNPNDYRNTQTATSSSARSYSLGIAATTIKDTSEFSYWATEFIPSDKLKAGSTLTLKAKVHLSNVQGQGVSLVLRGDKGIQRGTLFESTQGKKLIRGTADFAEYSVRLPYTQTVDIVLIYLLLLPGTTGTVTFSDVSIQAD